MAEHSSDEKLESNAVENEVMSLNNTDNLTQLEFIYDENNVQTYDEIIQPLMPFYLTSPILDILNEDEGIGETIIVEIETEENDASPQKPIPDEIRESTLEMMVCFPKTGAPNDSFKCEICNRTYGCLNCLKSHYETMHLGNTIICQYKCKYAKNVSKGLYCPVCELVFGTRSDTMDHYITHAVACESCGSGFDRQSYLTEHMRTVHNENVPEAVYACALCKLAYQYVNALSKHYQNIHKIILCVECDEKFESVEELKTHEQVHRSKIDVLPFACSKCDKAFAQISEIAVHIRKDHNHKRKADEVDPSTIENYGGKIIKEEPIDE